MRKYLCSAWIVSNKQENFSVASCENIFAQIEFALLIKFRYLHKHKYLNFELIIFRFLYLFCKHFNRIYCKFADISETLKRFQLSRNSPCLWHNTPKQIYGAHTKRDGKEEKKKESARRGVLSQQHLIDTSICCRSCCSWWRGDGRQPNKPLHRIPW